MSDSGAEHLLFIGGRFQPSESGATIPLVDASGKAIGTAAQAGEADAVRCVEAARKAFSQWSSISGYARGAMLLAVARSVERNTSSIAASLSSAGVSRRRAEREVISVSELFDWYAGWCDKFAQVYGSVNPVQDPYVSFSVPEPIGVVGLVAPSDSLLLGAVSRLAPALTAGNTAILVASQGVAGAIGSLAKSIAEARLPDGTVNVLNGDTSELVDALVSGGGIDALDVPGGEAEGGLGGEIQLPGVSITGRESGRGPESIGRYCRSKGIWHSVGK